MVDFLTFYDEVTSYSMEKSNLISQTLRLLRSCNKAKITLYGTELRIDKFFTKFIKREQK